MLYLIGWVNHFHLILVVPILCISIAKMIYDLPYIVRFKKSKAILSSTITAGIVLFGIISTTTLISTNLSYVQLNTAAYIGNSISPNDSTSHNISNAGIGINNNTRDKVTVISGPIYSWIYKYALGDPYAFSHLRDTQPIMTDKIILVLDPFFKRVTAKTDTENQTQAARLNAINADSHPAVVFSELPANYSKNTYPFTGINDADSYRSTTEIWQNYYYNDKEQ
jgi:hypothetical protein